VIPVSIHADLVSEVFAGPGFGADSRSAVGRVLGSLVHDSSPRAPRSSHEDSPLVVSDPYSGAGTNDIGLVLDLVAAFVVTNASGVAGFTKNP
jgi:hypothetical protein